MDFVGDVERESTWSGHTVVYDQKPIVAKKKLDRGFSKGAKKK